MPVQKVRALDGELVIHSFESLLLLSVGRLNNTSPSIPGVPKLDIVLFIKSPLSNYNSPNPKKLLLL